MTTVARVTSPADLAASVPELLGFTPSESLVVLALHEPRGRLGLTMRFDLADAELGLSDIPARLEHVEATRAALLVFTGSTGELPHGALVDALTDGIEARGIRVMEALLVREGTWWSYTCTGSCCPASGTPVTPAHEGLPGLLAAERVLAGRTLMGSREELVASFQPVLPLGPDVRLAQLDVAAEDLLDDVVDDREGAEAAAVGRLRRALRDPAAMTAQESARCLVALRLVAVRDEVLSWVPAQADEVRELAVALCRSAPLEAPALTVLGAAAYAQGGGALARTAFEAALAVDPEQRMAALLQEALAGQVPPSQVRRALTPTRRSRRVGG